MLIKNQTTFLFHCVLSAFLTVYSLQMTNTQATCFCHTYLLRLVYVLILKIGQIKQLSPPNFWSERLHSYEARGQSFFLFNKLWRESSHTALTVFVTHVYRYLRVELINRACLSTKLSAWYYRINQSVNSLLDWVMNSQSESDLVKKQITPTLTWLIRLQFIIFISPAHLAFVIISWNDLSL